MTYLTRESIWLVTSFLISVPRQTSWTIHFKDLTPKITLDEFVVVSGVGEEEVTTVNSLSSTRVSHSLCQGADGVQWCIATSVKRVDTRQKTLLPHQTSWTVHQVGVTCQVTLDEFGLVWYGEVDLSSGNGGEGTWVT